MDTYRRQLAAQLAQTLVMRGKTEDGDIGHLAVMMAAEVTERLRAIEAEETAAVDVDRCAETHPLDGARCTYKTEIGHDLHRDDRGRHW